MNIDITSIIQAVIALVATIISCVVIPWVRANTTEKQQAYITVMSKTLAMAAEQLYGAGHGEEKLGYVERELSSRGVTFDRAIVEAAVMELFNMAKGD